jgi:phosphoribosyl 1,2-cyclic phosphodiesterase
VKVTLWGTRGSLASPGPETARYGGNTSCVGVEGSAGTVLALDAGTGLRRLGGALGGPLRRIDVLLTHLHMDHIQGLGFFPPLYDPEMEVHVWAPVNATLDLGARLSRYLGPPLFPIHLKELPCRLVLHEVAYDSFEIGEFRVESALVCHPDLAVGYRITAGNRSVTYLPDHEPALGVRGFPLEPQWTSGYSLAEGVDLLIHDSQYTRDEYGAHVGWGHSSLDQALAFAELTSVRQLVPFHHDPSHTDADLDAIMGETLSATAPTFAVTPGMEGTTFEL